MRAARPSVFRYKPSSQIAVLTSSIVGLVHESVQDLVLAGCSRPREDVPRLSAAGMRRVGADDPRSALQTCRGRSLVLGSPARFKISAAPGPGALCRVKVQSKSPNSA